MNVTFTWKAVQLGETAERDVCAGEVEAEGWNEAKAAILAILFARVRSGLVPAGTDYRVEVACEGQSLPPLTLKASSPSGRHYTAGAG